MQRSRATFAAVASMAILSLGLTACGSPGGSSLDNDASGSASATENPKQLTKEVKGKTNITWWSHSQPTFVAANKAAIQAFEAANPDINIVYTTFPVDVFPKKLQAAFRTNEAPDMMQIFGTDATGYAKSGLLAAAPESVTKEVKNYWPAAIGAYEYKGKTYGLPHEFNIENGGMLVDPAKLKAAGLSEPTTWDQLISTGQKLTKLDSSGKATQVGFAFSNNDSITYLFLSMLLQQGGHYWTDGQKKVDFMTPEALKAWQAETDMITKDKIDSEKWYTGDSFDVFFQGKAAMAMRGPWSVCAGKESFPDQAFKYVPMPSYTGTSQAFAAESGWGEVVNAKSDPKKAAAAWKFIEFMNSPDTLRQWNVGTCTIPAIKSMQNDPAIQQAIPGVKASTSILDQGQWVGPVGDRTAFWQSIHDAFTSVSLGQKSPKDALKQAQDEINDMLASQE